MKKQKTTKKPLELLHKYWLTAVLLIVLLTLFRQNFIINQFPMSLWNKQKVVERNINRNQALDQQNRIKTNEIKTQSASDSEVLESQARYRFGLIKKGETYYQIN